nr:hypothetical protein [Nocardioides sp. B-3]
MSSPLKSSWSALVAQQQARLVAEAAESRGVDGHQPDARGDDEPDQGPGQRGRRTHRRAVREVEDDEHDGRRPHQRHGQP